VIGFKIRSDKGQPRFIGIPLVQPDAELAVVDHGVRVFEDISGRYIRKSQRAIKFERLSDRMRRKA
jgi:hypothetical protein